MNREPLLGYATTRQLLEELTARIEVDASNGGGGLDYKTVSDQQEVHGDAPDRMTKLRELVEYLHEITGAVPPEGTAWPDGSYAFDAAAGYVQSIIDGDFDGLPWGVADALSGRPIVTKKTPQSGRSDA